MSQLDEIDSRHYLVDRRNLDPPIADVIFKLTRGHALALALAADLIGEARAEASAEVLPKAQRSESSDMEWPAVVMRQLFHRLLEQLDRQGRNGIRSLLPAIAPLRWFDDLIVNELQPGATAEVLAFFSFVEKLPSGRFRLHAIARNALLFSMSSEVVHQLRRRLAKALSELVADRWDWERKIELSYQEASRAPFPLQQIAGDLTRGLRECSYDVASRVVEALRDLAGEVGVPAENSPDGARIAGTLAMAQRNCKVGGDRCR